MVRAKFRVLEVKHHLRGYTLLARPVISKNDDWPQGSEENKAFWEASPYGELEMRFGPKLKPSMKVGSYYYVDLEQTTEEGRHWKLFSVEQSESTQTVKLGLPWEREADLESASLMIAIDNKAAWPHFDRKVGSYWKVSLTLDETQDGEHSGCPYTDL
jgi:hypothetical protein